MSDQTASPTLDREPTPEGAIRFAPSNRPQPAPSPQPDPADLGPDPTEPAPIRSSGPNPRGELGDNAAKALRGAVSGAGSSRASIEAAAGTLSPVLVAVLQGGGMVVHTRRTPEGQRIVEDPATKAQQVALIWVPTTDEAEQVAGPLARIAARRMPDGIGEDSDIADAFGAVLAAGLFTVGQLLLERQWRAQQGPTVPAAEQATSDPSWDQAPA